MVTKYFIRKLRKNYKSHNNSISTDPSTFFCYLLYYWVRPLVITTAVIAQEKIHGFQCEFVNDNIDKFDTTWPFIAEQRWAKAAGGMSTLLDLVEFRKQPKTQVLMAAQNLPIEYHLLKTDDSEGERETIL